MPNRPVFSSRRRSGGGIAALGCSGLIALLIVGGIIFGLVSTFRVRTVDLTVKRTYIALTGHGSDLKHQKRVITIKSDGQEETFKVADSLLHGHFNSADTFATLDPGKRYECKVTGYRIPLFSHFRNILHCTPR